MAINKGFDKKVLLGADLSGNNKNSLIPQGLPFYFIKATEGKTFINESMNDIMRSVWNSNDMPIYGFYHFARPENNTALSEAQHYINVIKNHLGQCLLAIDIEGNALKVNNLSNWVKEWMTYVYKETSVKPFFYASASFIALIQPEKDWDFLHYFPLWIAQYGVQNKYLHLKRQGNIWQFTSSPIDLDIFYGTYQDLQLKAIPHAAK